MLHFMLKTLKDTHNYFYFHCKTPLIKGKINLKQPTYSSGFPFSLQGSYTDLNMFGKLLAHGTKLAFEAFVGEVWSFTHHTSGF